MVRARARWLALALAVASLAIAQAIPPPLTALAQRANLSGSVTSWCAAQFRPAQTGAYAVAVNAAAGGRYIALEPDGRTTELGRFTGRPDLSCYSRDEAQQLDGAIRTSETIRGAITPRWDSTVVCGFISDTTAQCWQFSPAEDMFVRVGEWTT
jgi:hypothetical protein